MSSSRTAPAHALVTISSGRRRTRSTISPATGANSVGAVKKKNTRPAAPLLPVIVFTQIPMASQRAESPSIEKVCPIR